MTWTHEKFFFGLAALLSSAMSWTGAILTTGDMRWLLITITIGTLNSALLSLIFKKPDETIQLTAARCGLTILGTVFGSKTAAWTFNLSSVHTDPIALGGVAFAVSIVGFIVGFKALRYLEKRSESVAKRFIDSKFPGAAQPPD